MSTGVDIEADLAEGSADLAYAREGVARFIQNKVQPAWEEKEATRLGLFTAVPGKKSIRPKGYVRKDIPFSEEGAEALAKEAKGAEIVVGEDADGNDIKVDAGVNFCDVTEYTGAVAGVPAYRDAKEHVMFYLFEEDGKTQKLAASGEPRTLELFATNRGLPLPTEPWQDDTAFLAEVNRWLKAERKKQKD